MQLQPIVGAECAVCDKRILVDADGKNCKRCGKAVHRECGKAHKEKCSGQAAVAQRHDWDETEGRSWTPRVVLPLCVGALMTAAGAARLFNGGTSSPAMALVGVGLAVAVGGYVLESRR